ncbi:GlxA family transcriptional regulator [Galbibacter pacificus]|uniref:Helix-turn-helix domain-containing protein n=1 Tax=Galbibacter pacificus TaxID=2996052 RepID=A0ABT6FW11_9FLAO|nr:helix-turn-helix domain-containing protein [Galbibacter pacificus]MDG3584103.1 helix-turn-helix domain-containing protein [Galbibacter pacificus]MDG3587464.1 helix-turn-helix domain-containing protein [Galbibacter pacificus]
MKKVGVLVPHYSIIAAIGNTRYMFKMVNTFLKEIGKPPSFDVRLIAETPEISLNDNLYTIQADHTFEEKELFDLIIIPPTSGKMEASINVNAKTIKWVKHQYKNGADIASLCVGAFLLAETGLLNGKECSTHWKTLNQFRERYPLVKLKHHKTVTDTQGIYTSGGANTYWNLLIYLVKKFTCPEVALHTAKYFEVEPNLNDQSQFFIFNGNKSHKDDKVLEAQEYIEKNYTQGITLDQICMLTKLPRRTFQRRFKRITHFTVIEYHQRVKVEAAKKLLEINQKNISEIMFSVGYSDPKSFRAIFKKYTGLTPIQYKNRYSS